MIQPQAAPPKNDKFSKNVLLNNLHVENWCFYEICTSDFEYL